MAAPNPDMSKTYKITLHYEASPVTLRVHERQAEILTSRGRLGENLVDCWYVTSDDGRGGEWLEYGTHEVWNWEMIGGVSVVYPPGKEPEQDVALVDEEVDGR